jgi:hypothetical protein
LGVVWRLAEDEDFWKDCNDNPTRLLDALNATARVHNDNEFDSHVYDGLTKIAPQGDYQRLLAGGDFGQPMNPMCIAGMFSPTPPGCKPPPR